MDANEQANLQAVAIAQATIEATHIEATHKPHLEGKKLPDIKAIEQANFEAITRGRRSWQPDRSHRPRRHRGDGNYQDHMVAADFESDLKPRFEATLGTADLEPTGTPQLEAMLRAADLGGT